MFTNNVSFGNEAHLKNYHHVTYSMNMKYIRVYATMVFIEVMKINVSYK